MSLTSLVSPLHAALHRRGLGIADVGPRLMAYVLAVDLAVFGLVVHVLADWAPRGRDVAVFGLLLGLALLFEEGASRLARLQYRLSSDLKRDMTSVWTIAAAVALSPAAGVALLVLVLSYVWLRQHRKSGQPLYRMWFATSAAVLGLLCAGVVARHAEAIGTGRVPWALASSLAVFAAIVVHTVVNRMLITGALIGVGVRGRALVGSRDDNLTELSTLCLGGLVAVAAVHEPWLCLLVVVPMVVLQRAALVRELEAAAIPAAKTGLLNAVAWEQLAQRELARAERVSAGLAVLLIDIDRFKTVNDRYGHLVGDKVLAGVARSVRESVRDYDGLGRFGGEEFVAVLPDAGERDALVIAERIRLRVNSLRVADLVTELEAEGRGGEKLSVSIGVAVLGSDVGELTDMLHAADQALYRAKWNGRNQVQLARRGDEIPDVVSV